MSGTGSTLVTKLIVLGILARSNLRVSVTTCARSSGPLGRSFLAAEGEDLLDQLGRTLTPLQDQFETVANRTVRCLFRHDALCHGDDGYERIVDVVGDAAGQRAQSFELVGVVELVFEHPPLLLGALYGGDIGPDAGGAAILKRMAFHKHPAPVAQAVGDVAFARDLPQQRRLVGHAAVPGIGIEAYAQAPVGDFVEWHLVAQDAFPVRPPMEIGEGAIEGGEMLLFIEHHEGLRQFGDGFVEAA
jgi:hypothetical protein